VEAMAWLLLSNQVQGWAFRFLAKRLGRSRIERRPGLTQPKQFHNANFNLDEHNTFLQSSLHTEDHVTIYSIS
jgi:hypothetical protein